MPVDQAVIALTHHQKKSCLQINRLGDVAQEVELSSGSRRVAGSIHPGRVEVSLSKTPNPQLLLTSWLVPCMAANRRWCVNVCVNG